MCLDKTYGAIAPPHTTGVATVKANQFEHGVGVPYPNPTNATLTIPVKGLSGSVTLNVTSIDGKLILSKTVAATESTSSIQLSTLDLKPGTYILGVMSGSQKVYKQFSKL